MRRFGVLLASAVLGAAVAATGPARAFGGGHGGGFGGRSMATGGFNRGFGFNRSFAGVNHGRSVAMGGFDRGLGFNRGFNRFGFNRGFNSRFARFDRFHHFHPFRNRFAFVGGGWDWGYPNYDYAAMGAGAKYGLHTAGSGVTSATITATE
jgi:hypothetical protein